MVHWYIQTVLYSIEFGTGHSECNDTMRNPKHRYMYVPAWRGMCVVGGRGRVHESVM